MPVNSRRRGRRRGLGQPLLAAADHGAVGLVGQNFQQHGVRHAPIDDMYGIDPGLGRINGASLTDILRVFIYDLESVAIPAVMVGLAGAWFTAGKWMQHFALKIPLHWGIFAACSLFVLLLAASVAAINYILNASHNPAEALRYE